MRKTYTVELGSACLAFGKCLLDMTLQHRLTFWQCILTLRTPPIPSSQTLQVICFRVRSPYLRRWQKALNHSFSLRFAATASSSPFLGNPDGAFLALYTLDYSIYVRLGWFWHVV